MNAIQIELDFIKEFLYSFAIQFAQVNEIIANTNVKRNSFDKLKRKYLEGNKKKKTWREMQNNNLGNFQHRNQIYKTKIPRNC